MRLAGWPSSCAAVVAAWLSSAGMAVQKIHVVVRSEVWVNNGGSELDDTCARCGVRSAGVCREG